MNNKKRKGLLGKRVFYEDPEIGTNSSQLDGFNDTNYEIMVSQNSATPEFMESIKAIYKELNIDVEKQELAYIVISNLFDIEDDFEVVFCNDYGLSEFWSMMDLLSQSDDFIALLKETPDAYETYNILYNLLGAESTIKHDQLKQFYESLINEDLKPSIEEVELAKVIDLYVTEHNMSCAWMKYLSRIDVLRKYNIIVSSKS